ncbi:Alg9-like mannosyltransferase family-domain-containing protein [Parasitella parasitica]|nr:Alg9-like mannosyltransferase family-domain-containing protein [Parasitella parasitica]
MKLALGCLFALMVAEAYFAPFTKVEESFNLQATHDIIHQADQFDHVLFPGVVPRTFVGASLLSLFAWPLIKFAQLSSINQQVLVRVILSAFVVLSLGRFASGVKSLLGPTAANVTIMLIICQFHFVFWSSRTLPNTLALPWVQQGLSHWLYSLSQSSGRTQHLNWMIRLLTFAGVVFRFEVGILLVVLLISEYMHGTITVLNTLKQMSVTFVVSLLITVPLDSYLWNAWLWPEGMVFHFNAVLNKSSEWGTLPFYAYFALFLPRLLLISYPLACFSFATNGRVRRMLTPMIVYIALFSFLPHKEWRFIIYAIPVFTAAASASIAKSIHAASRSWLHRISLFVMLAGAAASFAIATTMFQASRFNYPGGEALLALHQIEKNKPYVHVHMDAETAMTGASLFGQSNPNWSYSKNEAHTSQDDFLDAHYTHVITARPEMFDMTLFEIIDKTYGLDKVQLKTLHEYKKSIQKHNISPIEFIMSPKLYTLRLINPQKVWIQIMLRKFPVVLYSKSYCPYCMAAKQLISKYCKHIEVIEVDRQRDGNEIQDALIELTGQRTFPNLFKSGKSLGGYDRLSALDREGKLAGLCDS